MKTAMYLARRFAVVVAILLGFAVVIPASTASAAPSCYGSSCEGLDPAATVCASDAYTILSRDAVTSTGDWGVMDLRYSPRCFSNWVRFTPWYGARALINNLIFGLVDGSPWIWRAGVANSLRGYIGGGGTLGWAYSDWTAMVTAAGTTCSSVGVYATTPSLGGGGARYSEGTYN